MNYSTFTTSFVNIFTTTKAMMDGEPLKETVGVTKKNEDRRKKK